MGFLDNLNEKWARPDRLDLRDRLYHPGLIHHPPQWPGRSNEEKYLGRYVGDGMILNQGKDGACTGFGLACVINYLLWRNRIKAEETTTLSGSPDGQTGAAKVQVSERMLYHLARFYDEWPGESYQGSSCRGAMKAWHRHGVCEQATWPYAKGPKDDPIAKFIKPKPHWNTEASKIPLGIYYRIDRKSAVDMRTAICEVGAIFVSAHVHDGWELEGNNTGDALPNFGELPKIPPPRKKAGKRPGHAFALVGYTDTGFIVQNSWGEKWGMRGFAILPYEDWVENGMDAWVAVLGSPVMLDSSSVYLPSSSENAMDPRAGSPLPQFGGGLSPKNSAEARKRNEENYYRSIVSGVDGRPVNRLVDHENGEDAIRTVAYAEPKKFFKRRPARQAKKIALFVHGGLTSEKAAIRKVQKMRPIFEENGIYPIFLIWKTGFWETLYSIALEKIPWLDDHEKASSIFSDLADAAAEAADRTLEVTMRTGGGKALWTEMKENALANTSLSGAGKLLLDSLEDLNHDLGDKVELHPVGFSAGAVVVGHLLDLIRKSDSSPKVPGISLMAPANNFRHALDHYREFGHGRRNYSLDVHLLPDEMEKDDRVGPYGKSLLYLVSRAFELHHKTPLLGMASAWEGARKDDGERKSLWAADTEADFKEWKEWLETTNGPKKILIKKNHVRVRKRESRAQGYETTEATHGSFDNNLDVMNHILQKILGGEKPSKPFTDLQES